MALQVKGVSRWNRKFGNHCSRWLRLCYKASWTSMASCTSMEQHEHSKVHFNTVQKTCLVQLCALKKYLIERTVNGKKHTYSKISTSQQILIEAVLNGFPDWKNHFFSSLKALFANNLDPQKIIFRGKILIRKWETFSSISSCKTYPFSY